jgi:hypothetical protein
MAELAVGALTEPRSVAVTSGAEHVRTYAPEEGDHKHFCER